MSEFSEKLNDTINKLTIEELSALSLEDGEKRIKEMIGALGSCSLTHLILIMRRLVKREVVSNKDAHDIISSICNGYLLLARVIDNSDKKDIEVTISSFDTVFSHIGEKG